MRTMNRWMLGVVLCMSCMLASAHVGNHPSVHDTLAGIVERFRTTLPADELVSLQVPAVLERITAEERDILGTQYLTFRVNVPVILTVFKDTRFPTEPFWLVGRGFKQTSHVIQEGKRSFEGWELNFPAGEVGLGISSLSGGSDHYFVALAPQNAGDKVEITQIYPGQHTLGVLEDSAAVHLDGDGIVSGVPEALKGQVLLRGAQDRRREAQLISLFQKTEHPSSATPDQVVLTWSDDPKTTQTIQWRTSTAVKKSVVRYQTKHSHDLFKRRGDRAKGETTVMDAPFVLNDPRVHRHTVRLTGLEPDTTYVYAVGDGSRDGWSDMAEFSTAPARVKPFSFIYMGDAQNGLDRWGSVVHRAFRDEPQAAFYIMAGDLVNRGAERNDWDSFFYNANGVFNNRQLVPVLGNHEYQNGNPQMYHDLFTLMTNGPTTIGPEKAYSFTYSNALFVILDSNQPMETQNAWLEEQLANSTSTWKIVTYHHPAYSSGPDRDNPDVRKQWGGIFDKYHVDLALQGHDHAYLRTYPMKNEQRVETPADGTIYIVSNSGAKFYEQGDFPYKEVGYTNLSMYQVLDIQLSDDRLLYRAYDLDGILRDTFEIVKQ